MGGEGWVGRESGRNFFFYLEEGEVLKFLRRSFWVGNIEIEDERFYYCRLILG